MEYLEMAVHINDDYEKLAKLFYPSIEASGNVYYGQTRKLTMDEVLGKNDFGFDAHIESFRVDDDEADHDAAGILAELEDEPDGEALCHLGLDQHAGQDERQDVEPHHGVTQLRVGRFVGCDARQDN